MRSYFVFLAFTLRRNIVQFIIVSVIMIILIVSSMTAYVNLYPTAQSRNATAIALGSNPGLNALVGKPDRLNTVEGFVAWRSIGTATLILAVWALFVSTRLLRGDEEQDRWELLLVGKTTIARATGQVLLALGLLSLLMFSSVFSATILTSHLKGLDWSVARVGFMSLVLVLIFWLFASVGSFTSQIFSTRSTALRVAGVFFGLSFMLRALGDISDKASWLASLSPLGWVEKLRPLTTENYFWLLPILSLVFLMIAASLFIASRRDYGGSLVSEKSKYKSHYWLLGNTKKFIARTHFSSLAIWVVGFFIANIAFGSFLAASGDAIGQSGGIQKQIGKITNSGAPNATNLMLGMIFLEMMVVLMFMVASQINKFRDDEARGYLDNLLVRPVARLTIINVKTIYIIIGVFIACLAIYFGSLIGTKSQNISIDSWLYISSVINLLAVPILLVGIGIFTLGFMPRYTSVILYSVIGWSFILEIVGSILSLNHWILDTSLLHHIAISPAVAVKWSIFWAFIGISAVLCVLGIWRYTRRDVELY